MLCALTHCTEVSAPLHSLGGLPPCLVRFEPGIFKTPAAIPLAGVFFVLTVS